MYILIMKRKEGRGVSVEGRGCWTDIGDCATSLIYRFAQLVAFVVIMILLISIQYCPTFRCFTDITSGKLIALAALIGDVLRSEESKNKVREV